MFPVEHIQCLTADREFRGRAWLRFLDSRGIVFRLRIPNHTRTTNKHGHLRLPVQRLFALRVRETMVLNRPRPIWEMKVYLACIRLQNEHAIIATNQAPETIIATNQAPETALAD